MDALTIVRTVDVCEKQMAIVDIYPMEIFDTFAAIPGFWRTVLRLEHAKNHWLKVS